MKVQVQGATVVLVTPFMGNPTMVPSGRGHAIGPTNSSSKHPRSVDPVSKLRLSSGRDLAPASHMESLWQHFQSKEIPGNAINLIMSFWRSKTNSNYNSAWEDWCRQKSMHPFSADFSSILGFLANQFEEGKQYRSLNWWRVSLWGSIHWL